MAETVQKKSTGLKFAEEQLLRHGWEKGKGLGTSENGITEAIKVKIKCDKGGVGHKTGEQFSFHWWDHVFNKASSGLVVESGQNGVMVKKSDDSNDGLISNQKPRKAQQNKAMLYGCFVKSATLLSGEERPEKVSDSDDSSSSSEDEDQKLDLSSTTKLSDADLLKACGGRTAHKGARHGLAMSAKLARLEQQEQEFMNKYGKKNNTAETSTSSTDSLNPGGCPDMKEKKKHKKSKRQEELSENNIHEDKMITHILSNNDTEDGKAKKRKDFNGASATDDMIADMKPKKKKRNHKEKEAPEDCVNGDCSIDVNEAFTHTSEERDTHLRLKKKKKKKRSKVNETTNTDDIREDSTDTHSKQPQEGSIEYQQASDSASKKKKKKKKSSMEHDEDVDNSTTMMTETEDTSNEAQIIEGQENERKKNRKKRSKKEEQEVVESVQFEEPVPKKKKKRAKSELT